MFRISFHIDPGYGPAYSAEGLLLSAFCLRSDTIHFWWWYNMAPAFCAKEAQIELAEPLRQRGEQGSGVSSHAAGELFSLIQTRERLDVILNCLAYRFATAVSRSSLLSFWRVDLARLDRGSVSPCDLLHHLLHPRDPSQPKLHFIWEYS